MEWWCWPLKLQATKAWSVATFAPILWGILFCSSPFQYTHTLYSRVPSFWCWGDTVLWKIPRVLHTCVSNNKSLLLPISGLGVSFSKPSFWVTYSRLHSWPASQKHVEVHGFRPSLHPYSRGTDSLSSQEVSGDNSLGRDFCLSLWAGGRVPKMLMHHLHDAEQEKGKHFPGEKEIEYRERKST